MNKDISAYSYSAKTRLTPLKLSQVLICCLLSVFCLLTFMSCATTPNTKDIKMAAAYNKLGLSYLGNNQTNKARVEFEKAFALNPKNKETLHYLGYINAIYEKYDNAISYYKQAIEVDPNYAGAMNDLGVTYLSLNKWDEAIIYFKAALQNPLYSTPAKPYTSMGYAYYMKNDYQEAEKSLREALMRNPVYPLANYTLGLVYLKMGNNEKAIDELTNAIAINSEYMRAHWELANIYLKTGKNAKALKHLEIVAEKDPEKGRMAIEQIEKLKY